MKLHKRLENTLFYLTVLSTPLNLGKHYISEMSYVYGKLIDYLIPTIYVQDILVTALLFFTFPELLRTLRKHLVSGSKAFVFLILFLVSVFLSVLGSSSFIPSFYAFLRLFLYAGFAFYVFSQRSFKQDYPILLKIFSVLVFLLSFLGILQWVNQGSVFNNYLFFGEQPYSISTPRIARENLFGISRVPPYGTFRHPNAFAAFLSFGLLFLMFGLITSIVNRSFGNNSEKDFRANPRILYLFICLLGFITLILNFSYFVLLSFVFSFVLSVFMIKGRFFLDKSCYDRVVNWVPLAYILLGLLITGLLFIFPGRVVHPSIVYRKNLLIMGYELIFEKFLFGAGFNNFTLFADLYAVRLGFPKFPQPIHNIYVLIFVESGVFAIFFFTLFLGALVRRILFTLKNSISTSSKREGQFLLILVLHLVLLGFFDHFLITSQQVHLLLWLTLGFALQYNLS